ncbi:MAG TPA: hypothetical protein VLK34_02200 [Nocardioidaceae bacterium]|nr:hypothetical protein [Nocardioidaceae bacterium]
MAAGVSQRGAVQARNVVPGAYRGVAVTSVDCALDEAALTRYFAGREAYRRTRFIVVRKGADTAIIAVGKTSEELLFAPITEVRLLAGPDECAYVEDPDVDTAVPTALGRAALEHAPGKRGVVVQGSYGHVSFIVDPAPLRVTVREVAPPYPPKLFDQTRRVLETAEHLPPIELVPDVVELADLAASAPAEHYLLPCRGGGVAIEGATTDYLDERPVRRPWTLIGCERSQQIHASFYGERADQVDICPRKRVGDGRDGAVLAKCCLLESHIEVDDNRVVVPWGASLSQVLEALSMLAAEWEPTWAPV